MADNLANTVQQAGKDILFVVQFTQQGNGLSLLDCQVSFYLKYQGVLLTTRSISSGLTRTTNTAALQELSGSIPAIATRALPGGRSFPDGAVLTYDWAIVSQGYTLGDISYQQSFTLRKF